MIEALLNRCRGTGAIKHLGTLKVFNKEIEIMFNGNHLYGLYLALVTGLVAMNAWLGLAVLVAYLVGEAKGWGKWVGSLCHPENITDEVKNSKCGKSFPYIHYMANYIQNQDKDYKLYCQIALAIRGFIWWSPIMILIGYIGLLDWYAVLLNTIILSIGFPIACIIGKNIDISYNSKYLNLSKGWENQEVVYGIIQFVCITLTILIYKVYNGI